MVRSFAMILYDIIFRPETLKHTPGLCLYSTVYVLADCTTWGDCELAVNSWNFIKIVYIRDYW